MIVYIKHTNHPPTLNKNQSFLVYVSTSNKRKRNVLYNYIRNIFILECLIFYKNSVNLI